MTFSFHFFKSDALFFGKERSFSLVSSKAGTINAYKGINTMFRSILTHMCRTFFYRSHVQPRVDN